MDKYQTKMYPKQNIKRREPIFAGAEGQSEVTLIAWLQQICDDAGLALYLDAHNARGGYPEKIVKNCIGTIRTLPNRRESYVDHFILLDSDVLKDDIELGRNPVKLAKENDINLIFLEPNIEGFYYRMCKEGNEKTILDKDKVENELERIWPDYKKNISKDDLIHKFTVEDIRRVAKYDKNVEKLLSILGLLEENNQSDSSTTKD